ncbi:hypothetical protein [Streptomyces sp. KR80]|uniref:hypothetical protein n=1 Tax=Streptomyces sp. KR80 TaxID=3457426 RepID=UPI003FD5FCB8
MSARRPLLTATAAGSVLCALWFVPSANATVEDSGPARSRVETAAAEKSPQGGSQDLALADTGSVDTTPYLVGGTVFLGIGAVMVAATARRSRTTEL